MRIVSVVGARPQFVKLGVICRAMEERRWAHRIIHTGQHYDPALSRVIFDELGIPEPDHHLGVGSGSHGAQTGEMLRRLEPALAAESPDWVLLYGDTNSTLAGAVAASKLGLRLAHLEAGLRSYRRGMPEEINRVVADHLSDLLLCPTSTAVSNLEKEGLGGRAVLTGDVMYDAVLTFREAAERRGEPLAEQWRPGSYALATVHRAENTDAPARLREIVSALAEIARSTCPVLWPVHPRTKHCLEELNCAAEGVTVAPPVSYLSMLYLESRARVILTDSGGVQKEAYFFGVPCITLRDETEWTETLAGNCNIVTGASREAILRAVALTGRAGPWRPVYGDGAAGAAVVRALESYNIP